jgi:hypothetical protein
MHVLIPGSEPKYSIEIRSMINPGLITVVKEPMNF